MSAKERMRTRDPKAKLYDSELEISDVIKNGSAVRPVDFQRGIRVTPNNSQIKEIKKYAGPSGIFAGVSVDKTVYALVFFPLFSIFAVMKAMADGIANKGFLVCAVGAAISLGFIVYAIYKSRILAGNITCDNYEIYRLNVENAKWHKYWEDDSYHTDYYARSGKMLIKVTGDKYDRVKNGDAYVYVAVVHLDNGRDVSIVLQ